VTLPQPTGLVPAGRLPDQVEDGAAALLVRQVLAAIPSPETRRAYNTALTQFLAWCQAAGKPPFSAELVAQYRDSLAGRSSSTVGVALAAIKRLATTASLAELLPVSMMAAIHSVKGPSRRGHRIGNWLTLKQVRALLTVPDLSTLKGKRDHAILAVLIGCALRRAELVGQVTVEAIALREDRWVLVDLTGKGNRVRSVAIPGWVKQAIDVWTTAAGITTGAIFRAVGKGGRLWREGLSPGAVLQIVRAAGIEIGADTLAPHDLRRICAKLCRKKGGELEQIQMLLGHSSIATTERYLGSKQDLVEAVNDDIL
jgi:site-specific recombinase XerD